MLFSSDAEANIEEFQKSNPEFSNETIEFTQTLFFQNGWAGNGCEFRSPSKAESMATEAGGLVPGISILSGLIKMERGIERVAGAEGCIVEQLPPLSFQIMAHNLSQEVPVELGENASKVCEAFRVRKEGAEQIEEAALELVGGKIISKTGKIAGKIIVTATGDEIPLIEVIASYGTEQMVQALLPDSSQKILNMESSVCGLSTDLQSNWADELRDQLEHWWNL